MSQLYDIAMLLAGIVIFIVIHYTFKNIRDVCFWSCKILTTLYLWSLLWIATQLHHMPEWKASFTDSIWTLVNMTSQEL